MAQQQEDTQTQAAAYLVIQQGQNAGRRVEICKECTTIGRSRACDIFLEDVFVHRKQASILYTNKGYILRDDHGSGDSLINDQAVTMQLLNDGDQLLFGHTHLTFYAREATRQFQLPVSRGRELHKGKEPDPASGSVARLEMMQRLGTVQSFELQAEMSIGRSRNCAIFLEDLAVSRHHANLRQLPDGEYELEDCHSATGTFVNGQSITRCRLRPGDIVQIGASRLAFRRSPA